MLQPLYEGGKRSVRLRESVGKTRFRARMKLPEIVASYGAGNTRCATTFAVRSLYTKDNKLERIRMDPAARCHTRPHREMSYYNRPHRTCTHLSTKFAKRSAAKGASHPKGDTDRHE